MKRVLAAAAVAVFGFAAMAGCGGDSQDTAADEQAIRDLIQRVNQATAARDAGAACDAFAPSSIRAQFNTRGQCVRETAIILKQAGDQQPVQVQSVSVDGDRARVSFKNRTGEVEVVRENGKWYIPIESGQAETADGPSGADGAAP